ncbi:MAG TPA: hypothetical protein VHL78_08585 [Actinomycetota bacterium]|nr:hypothetical protein [Actinomycetota bacterium]
MTELNEAERTLVESYRTLERVLRDQREDLAPFAERNATKALAVLWQVVNGLDEDAGQPYDLGA